jgi:hypothetical protein
MPVTLESLVAGFSVTVSSQLINPTLLCSAVRPYRQIGGFVERGNPVIEAPVSLTPTAGSDLRGTDALQVILKCLLIWDNSSPSLPFTIHTTRRFWGDSYAAHRHSALDLCGGDLCGFMFEHIAGICARERTCDSRGNADAGRLSPEICGALACMQRSSPHARHDFASRFDRSHIIEPHFEHRCCDGGAALQEEKLPPPQIGLERHALWVDERL